MHFLLCECPSAEAEPFSLLLGRRDQLSQLCSAQLFDEEVDMAESIDFQIPMKAACTREMGTLCKDVPHGHARVIR